MAGRAPFEADTVSLVAWKHVKANKVSLKTFAPQLHNETVRVINKGLERDPELRYQTYDELIAAFEAALKTCRQVPVEEEQKVRDLTGEKVEQWIGLYVLIGLVLVVILSVAIWFLINNAKQQRVDPLLEMLREVEIAPAEPPPETPRGRQ